MFITSTRRFVVVLLALASRRADASLSCRESRGKYYVVDPDGCRVDDINDYFNGGEQWLGRCDDDGWHYAFSQANCQKTADNMNNNAWYSGGPTIKCDSCGQSEYLVFSTESECKEGTDILEAVLTRSPGLPCSTDDTCSVAAGTCATNCCNPTEVADHSQQNQLQPPLPHCTTACGSFAVNGSCFPLLEITSNADEGGGGERKTMHLYRGRQQMPQNLVCQMWLISKKRPTLLDLNSPTFGMR